jgi:hypothetical protein
VYPDTGPKGGNSIKGLIARLLLPIPSGCSSKEFTNWLFYREVALARWPDPKLRDKSAA